MKTATGRLRAVREARGLSLADLARNTGLDKGELSKIERGLRRPTFHALVAICRALGLRAEAETISRLWP
jgi:transcriptional regulator with XRE-family HTH domain